MEGGLTKSQITNCILSIFGIFGNTLTILLFACDKKLLKKFHNILFFVNFRATFNLGKLRKAHGLMW